MNLEVIKTAFIDELSKISSAQQQEKYAAGLLRAMDKYAEFLQGLPQDKYAQSLGFAAAKAGNGVNPTLSGVDQAHSVYQGLDAGTKKLIESHPLVTQHGMAPHAAMQVAGWSAQPGQSLGEFFAQNHPNMPTASQGAGATSIGRDMATRAPMARAAAPVSGVRPAAAATAAAGKLMPAVAKAPVAAVGKAMPAAGALVGKAMGGIARKAPGLGAIASGALHAVH